MLYNNWFTRQLCIHRDMKHLGSLEGTQEARDIISGWSPHLALLIFFRGRQWLVVGNLSARYGAYFLVKLHEKVDFFLMNTLPH